MASNKKIYAVLNSAAFLFVITMNYLAVTLPLNNKTTGQLSDQYPNLFTPAGFTFSIWGFIYLFLTGFIIYQWIQLWRNGAEGSKILTITPLFIINCLANGAWLFAWHYEMVPLSVAIMLVMLSTLIVIHNKLNLALPWSLSSGKWFLHLPFSLYLGWISIATIANVTVLFVHYGITPFNLAPLYWTLIVVSIGAGLALLMLLKANVVHGLVVAWALYGILAKRSVVDDSDSRTVVIACWIAIVIIMLSIIIHLLNGKRRGATIKIMRGKL